MQFTHLHVHTHYSLLDGLPKIDQVLDYVKKNGMDSVAITDHGVLYGAVEFYKKAKEKGIKPIIGCEMYMAYENLDQKRPNIDNKRYHLVLLAKNEQGYKNLVKLVTISHLQGFYYKPRIDDNLLEKHCEGLIAMSACVKGRIPQMILAGKIEEAEKIAKKYQELFGKDNFYLEIQHHPNLPEQVKINPVLIEMSKKLDIPLVATNDCHYLRSEDAEAQDILMLINTGAKSDDPERLTMKSEDYSMHSPKKMKEFFKDTPQAIENTQKIAEKCNFEFKLGEIKLPYYELPQNKNQDNYLKELCEQGMEKRFHNSKSKTITDRLEYELKIIKKMGFASYFLIVQDFVNWAKQNRIVVGPGRGSAAGSLVSYLLNITDIDPIKYNLLFERFLNPSRISMPDIDLDFTDWRRDQVINYIAEKYGKDKVAQIITFGTMAARAVIRDVGRALQYPYPYCDQIAKMIPLGFTLDQTLQKIDEFKELYESDEKATKLIDLAKKLEGVARHASTHACGLVISKEPLTEIVPLQHPKQDDETIITQYEMHSIDDLGLLKMDLLGLKNLTIIEDTLARIYKVQNKSLKIEDIPLDDEKVYKLLQKADSTSVFQLESDGMKRYLKQLKPSEFEDIIAMIALYRPGPMQFISEYIKGKHGKKKIEYLHPKLKPILEKTYGIMIYQEQLMQVVQQVAGFTLAEADILRKAVGKKIKNLLLEQKEKFIQGAIKNNASKQTAEKIWEWILPFASYGFNRCLTADTQIINADTGKIFTIQELLSSKQKNFPSVLSCDKNLKLKKTQIEKIFSNGEKSVYEIITRLGKKIKVTNNHPFLTVNGWKTLEQLKQGSRIALSRKIPINNKGLSKIKNHHLSVLGYILSEGNLCHPHGFYFYSTKKEELEDYKKALEKFKNTKATLNKSKKAISIYAGRINLKRESEAVKWIEKIGLKWKKATQKEFPDFTFQLNKKQLSLLIAKMFQGDGCINYKRKYPQIFYATSSVKLARQFQHLLLRLEVISSLHTKKFKYRNEIKIGYTININRYESIKNFHFHICQHLIGKPQKTFEKIIKNHPIISGKIKKNSARGSKDIIPIEMREIIKKEIRQKGYSSLKKFARENNFSERLLWKNPRKKGYLRETVQIIGKSLNSKTILDYANSDIYWDEIVKIKSIGKEKTYDLTIKNTHNFLANDFIVHNSHAASYAMIAYRTAYLKTHFPVEFMAAVLTSERQDIEKIAFLIDECKRMKIEVLAPDINESFRNFSVVPDARKIRFGLLAIKNVGHNVVEKIVEERKKDGKFVSITNFISRVASKDINKRSMEALIKTGAFDKFEERNKLLVNLEKLLEWNRETQKNKDNGQKGLFDGMKCGNNSGLVLSPAPVINKKEKLNWEKELLGLYISSHPMEGFMKIFERGFTPLVKITQDLTGRMVKIGAIISSIKKITTKTGKPMFFVKLEDKTDKIELVVFPSVIEQNPNIFQENKIVMVKGKVDNRDGVVKIICNEIEEIVEE